MSDALPAAALRSLDEGISSLCPSSVFALFSGGDDSLTATHIASRHPSFSGVVHLDTGTGIPETRAFVEDTCRTQGWPLKVYSAPPGTYERLVLEGYRTRDGRLLRGFPHGPSSHSTMYWHLKQQQIRAVIREHKQHRLDHVGFVSGVRIPESARRARAKIARAFYQEPSRAVVWFQPVLEWTKVDCLNYLKDVGLERNPVSVNCHRSGECLCGALANHAELAEIAFFYPHVGQRYARLADEVRARGIANDQWAGGPTITRRATARSIVSQPLCTACQLELFA